MEIDKDPVSPPSSPFHGYTEEEVRSVSISVGLSKPTVFVYDDVEVEYVLLSEKEAKEKEELYQQQDWSGVEEQVEKKTVPWTYMSGKAPLLSGTKSRIKMNIIDKYPTSDMAFSHLPKTESVLLCMFQHLLEDEGREQNSNPLTVSTIASIKRSAKKTTPIIKSVWLHHFSDVLINHKETKMIVEIDDPWTESSPRF